MRRWNRRRVLNVAVVIAAVVVALIVLLIVLGYLVLPTSPSGEVTLYGVHWEVQQGTTSGGQGWFGPSQFNYSFSEGYPVEVTPGGTVSIPWAFSNYDAVNHTVLTILVGAPYTLVGTSPSLPAVVPSGTDDAFLSVTVQAPSSPGLNTTLVLEVEVV